MAFIDHTYFNGALTIGDISNGNSPVVGNTVNTAFIPRYEKAYLTKALGYDLYKAFMAGLEEVAPEQKWLDLRDGVDYEVNGKARRWDGFKNADKVSPIANYVFVEYLSANAIQSNGTGTGVNNQQNSVNASPAAKQQRAWSDMLDMNNSLEEYLNQHSEDYPEYHNCDWYGWGWYPYIHRRFGFRNVFGL